MHRCIRCGHVGPESDFLVMPNYPFGVSQTCNECLKPILAKDIFSPRHSAAAVRARKRAGMKSRRTT